MEQIIHIKRLLAFDPQTGQTFEKTGNRKGGTSAYAPNSLQASCFPAYFACWPIAGKTNQFLKTRGVDESKSQEPTREHPMQAIVHAPRCTGFLNSLKTLED
jgi:hypothetical protein